jgi:hypothetical protein
VAKTGIGRQSGKGEQAMMARQARIRGYVLGSDEIQGATVWKVRVKDETNKFDGRKFVVASVHDNFSLAEGLEVTFVLGQFQERGQAVFKAIDVQLFNEAQETRRATMETAQNAENPDSLKIVVTRVGDELSVHITEETEEKLVNFYPTAGLDEESQEELVCIVPFNIYDWTAHCSDANIVDGFTALRSLMILMPIQEAIESLIAATLRTFAEKQKKTSGE